MAVLARFGGLTGSLAEDQVQAPMDYGAVRSAAGNKGYQYNCAGVVSGAQSELTCNGGGGVVPSRKRGREAELEQYVSTSSAALLPISGMHEAVVVQQSLAAAGAPSRMVDSAMTSTSGRPAAASVADALAWEPCRQGAEIDAVVRAECERLRAGMGQARKRHCQALVRAVVGAAAQRLREKEAELETASRRAAELEERVRQAAAESQAWCELARANEAAAAGFRATLGHILLRSAAAPAEEGFVDSDPAAADDAQSCFFEVKDTAAATSAVSKWACKACGEGEASVLLLPCRHLCLCKSCEPRLEACPVCLAAKNASIHIAAI